MQDQPSLNISGKKIGNASEDDFKKAKEILSECKSSIRSAFVAARTAQDNYTKIDAYIKNFKDAVGNLNSVQNDDTQKVAAAQAVADEAKKIGVKLRTADGKEIYVQNNKREIIVSTNSNAAAKQSVNIVNPKFYAFAGLVKNEGDDVKISGRENLNGGKDHFYGSFDNGKRKKGAYVWDKDKKYIGSFDGPINGYGCWKMKHEDKFNYILGKFENDNYGAVSEKKQVPFVYFRVDGSEARFYNKFDSESVEYKIFSTSETENLKGIISNLFLEDSFDDLGTWEEINRWAEDKFNMDRKTLYLLGSLGAAAVGYVGWQVYKYFKGSPKKKTRKSRWNKFDNPSSNSGSSSSDKKNKITSKDVNEGLIVYNEAKEPHNVIQREEDHIQNSQVTNKQDIVKPPLIKDEGQDIIKTPVVKDEGQDIIKTPVVKDEEQNIIKSEDNMVKNNSKKKSSTSKKRSKRGSMENVPLRRSQRIEGARKVYMEWSDDKKPILKIKKN
jgi:hypothetical protein